MANVNGGMLQAVLVPAVAWCYFMVKRMRCCIAGGMTYCTGTYSQVAFHSVPMIGSECVRARHVASCRAEQDCLGYQGSCTSSLLLLSPILINPGACVMYRKSERYGELGALSRVRGHQFMLEPPVASAASACTKMRVAALQ